MKKVISLGWFFCLFASWSCATLGAQPLSKPHRMKAVGYSHHVELSFDNHKSYTYEIYRSVDGKNFSKCVETTADYYNDFFTPKALPQEVTYRLVPKGLTVKDARLSNFEIKTTMNTLSDDELLDMVQRQTTRYFADFAHPINGMARERSNESNRDIVTTGGSGFGIMALVAGAERGYLSRIELKTQLTKIVNFLETVERFQGAWAHWYDGYTGKPFSFSKYDDGGDLVETAFLVQGLLVAKEYIKNGDADERNLAYRIDKMWREVNWNWYTQGSENLYWHWSKNWSFRMNHRLKGFDETLITYVLAASSPTYPIKPEVYHKCFTNSDYHANGKSYFGIPLSLGMDMGGPLFFTHYSFLGMNPKGLKDRYADYFERNRAHVLIHQAYAKSNPKGHKGYSDRVWGFTSSDDALMGYTSHHPGTDSENGTVSPTAAVSSLPYAPEIVLPTIRHFYEQLGSKTWGKYGFYDAFNLSLPEGQQTVRTYLAIDQGPIAVMIENYRSGLIWNLFGQMPEVKEGLKRMEFTYDVK